MANTFKYYKYGGYSYRIEFNTEGKPVNGEVLIYDGHWKKVKFDWQIMITENTPISEKEVHFVASEKDK